MDGRLVLRQTAAPHELADERVIGRQLLETPLSVAVGPRVADVREGGRLRVLVDEGHGGRRTHSRGCRIADGVLEDPRVRRADDPGDLLLAPDGGGAFLDRGGGEP